MSDGKGGPRGEANMPEKPAAAHQVQEQVLGASRVLGVGDNFPRKKAFPNRETELAHKSLWHITGKLRVAGHPLGQSARDQAAADQKKQTKHLCKKPEQSRF